MPVAKFPSERMKKKKKEEKKEPLQLTKETGLVEPTYQIGDTIFPDRESFEKAKGLIEMRIPPGSKQIDLAAGDAIRQAVAESEKIAPSPFVSPETREAKVEVEAEMERIEEEERPVKRELGPEPVSGSWLPVVGALATPVTNAILQQLDKSKFLKKRGWGQFSKLKPEDLRTAELTEIERQVYAEGVTASEAVGTIFDVLPWSEMIGGIETPTGNIQAIRKNIKKEKTRANFNLQLVRQGDLTVEVGKELLDASMLDIQRYESRIKLLINYSPDLRFNSDEINVIETEILTVREVIFAAQKEVLRGKIEDPSELATWKAMNPIDYGDLE